MMWLTALVLTVCLVGIVEPATSKPFRWCTVSDKEKLKCDDFVKGLKVVSNRTGVAINPSCVAGTGDEDCMMKIKENKADFITLDSGKVYIAGKMYSLVPIAYEDTGDSKGYYAVAVAKTGTVVTLKTLKGKKTCHTGYRRTSGWNMPVGYLLGNADGFRKCGNPSDAYSAAQYFSKSCVPGLKMSKGLENLCALCDKCLKDGKYAGYTGAFNCMKDGMGDVAFVKHLTTAEVVGSNMTKDYKYLCTDGKTTVVTAKSHENCNFGFSPSHTVMARNGDNANNIKILEYAAKNCTASMTASNCGGFLIFESKKYGGDNLLFKDSTKELKSVGDKNTYDKWLGEYAKSMDALNKADPCSSSVVYASYSSLVIAMYVLVKILM